MSVKEEHRSLLFSIRRSIRYHNRRRMFFDRLNIVSNALSVIFGSTTFFALLPAIELQCLAIGAAAMVTIISTINMVVGSVRAARLHSDLARRFIELEKKLVADGAPNKKLLSDITQERLDIEADEPPALIVLDAICHNELMRSMGYKEERMLRIGPFQRLLAQIVDYRRHTIKEITA